MKQNKYGTDVYSGKGYDRELAGISFDYFVRSPFAGVVVTPENRRAIMKMAYVNHLKEVITRDGLDEEGITDAHKLDALKAAKDFVSMNRKAERKYNKGDFYFNYKDKKGLMIPTEERVQAAKDRMEKYKTENPAIEVEQIENTGYSEVLPEQAQEEE